MPLEQLALLALAILLLLAAHVSRAVRLAFLFPRKKAAVPRFPLLIGLGIGYAVNALIPLRVGEVVRGSIHYRALFVVGLALFILSLGINYAAQKIVRRYRIAIG